VLKFGRKLKYLNRDVCQKLDYQLGETRPIGNFPQIGELIGKVLKLNLLFDHIWNRVKSKLKIQVHLALVDRRIEHKHRT